MEGALAPRLAVIIRVTWNPTPMQIFLKNDVIIQLEKRNQYENDVIILFWYFTKENIGSLSKISQNY